MKKTLLSLIITGVASTAFSATLYENVITSGVSAKLDFGGELRIHQNHNDLYLKNTTTNVKYLDSNRKTTSVRHRAWLYAKFTDANGLYLAAYGRLQWYYAYSATNNNLTDIKTQRHSRKGYVANYTYVEIGKPEFGTLRYGDTPTVLDNTYGAGTIAIGHADKHVTHGGFTAILAPTQFKSTIVYTSPNFLNDTTSVGVSYGESKSSPNKRTQQYAAQVTYSSGAQTVSAIYAQTDYKTTPALTKTTKSHDLQYVLKATDKLTFSAGLAYENDNDKAAGKTVKAFSVGAKIKYVLNQYFKPFIGATYLNIKDSEKGVNLKPSKDVYNIYLGTESDIYKYQALRVNLYAEGAIGLLSGKQLNEAKTALENIKGKIKSIGAGVRIRY